MKEFIEKHRTAIIITVLSLLALAALIAGYFFFLRGWIHSKLDGTYDNNFDIGDFEGAMKVVKVNYPGAYTSGPNAGLNTAQTVEQVFRLESANFTSTQYKQCGTAGMAVPAGAGWPFYGWSKLFFSRHPSYAPLGSVDDTAMKTLDPNWTGGKKIFVVLPSVEAGAMFLAYWLQFNPLASWGGGPGYVASVQNQATTIADNT